MKTLESIVECLNRVHKEDGGSGEIGEGSQKVQTYSYKINKFWDVIYNMATEANNAILYV